MPIHILDGYVGRDELAAMFRVSTRTITRWAAAPDGLPQVTIGARTMFRIESVRAWLAKREVQRNPTRRRKAA